MSGVPLESTPFRTQIELVRPSPINPDIPMDPKPPERIILDDSKPVWYEKSLNEVLLTSDDLRESTDNKQDLKSHTDQPANVKSDNNQNDDKRESDDTVNVKGKESIDSVTYGRPTAVYAIEADEKQRSETFQTSHHIPNVDGVERNFATSHHIPAHIEDERTKLIEYTKIVQKPLN